MTDAVFDPVHRPRHYNVHPSGIECIEVTSRMPFCLGNAVKYVWRYADKIDPQEDLRKAIQYLQYQGSHGGSSYPPASARELLRRVADADPDALRATVFRLIAEGALENAVSSITARLAEDTVGA